MSLKKKIVFRIAAVYLLILYFTSMGHCAPASDLVISGVFIDTKGGVALVNDSPVTVGETIEGAQVLKITDRGVSFRRNGQEFFQPVRDVSPFASSEKSTASAAPKHAAYTPPSSSPSKGGTMKTLYGMPIKNFFPDPETIKKEIQTVAAPLGAFNPAAAIQKANDLKATVEARNKETEQRIKEIEGQ